MSIHLGFHVRELWRMRISIALMDGLTDLSCNNLWLDPSVHESLSKSYIEICISPFDFFWQTETIFVRACESRMDLLRAVIIGAEGTPYHDGLFFFEIQFPDTYPSVPPKVHYHSGGLRINPNLYKCGKVCLSLIRTWTGKTREKWLPKESTMLQLLVSIQALILNEKPYFNEPGYEQSIGTPSGESFSKAYSENVFLLSLKTMHFEEFVRSHFFVRSHDIVKACNAYKNGASVGSMVKDGVKDPAKTRQSGSKTFRTNVASFMKTVVDEFVDLGAIREANHRGEPNGQTQHCFLFFIILNWKERNYL
ncbi:putative ubiquitin-conjugating enzyme E2 39 [Arabidopsis lyrata subsp. lyrata]|uniref:putative ubiquitin-conjugating enzyme E2 39 n=1 Tax=Arabidopsis lyrata subsp. lyrata TaxID=81972 RepID=UPI000A29E040|nr:putative ubiquitin-conjugating enzyme E2 39 [Arabidopsis lyrata subsp. lyrata]|eukprot:XP_020866217.1 putative ubiquitin-conjugating enzyme E2 39 [Arabidopsis lyrata subsp. lyrata]